MPVLLFASDLLAYGTYLRQKLEEAIAPGQLLVRNDVSRLVEDLLSRTIEVRVGIFCVQHDFDLDRLLAMRNLLESVFVILILPQIDEGMIAKCQRLRPRFISYSDAQFDDVVAVMNYLQWLAGKSVQ